MKQVNKTKVLVAMSGGVDSSVAAALLIRAGYDVTGAFMVNVDAETKGFGDCWQGDYQDALRVAAKLGIPLLRLNFTREYKKTVLDHMYREYRAGRTPNPDVLCNKFVKFGAWLKKARDLGFDYLATGHYASTKTQQHKNAAAQKHSNTKTIELIEAKDENKDQTYFLHQLTQKQLKYVIFPVGKYLKSEVRTLARRFNLPTAGKEESMGICFIGEVPMKKFLKQKIKIKKGQIVLSSGEAVGEHDGLAFYTIGERIGLKFPISTIQFSKKSQFLNTKPIFVVGKNLRRNELIVGYEDSPLLFSKEIAVKNINWIAGRPPKFPLKCEVRLRHRQVLQKCVVRYGKVIFKMPQRAATPGQFAVFYKNDKCLGGGVIY